MEPDTLPQPPREPMDMTHHEHAPQGTPDFIGDTDNTVRTEPVQDAPAEDTTPQPIVARAKIGITYARQLDERVRVMQERLDAFVRELEKVGITNPHAVLSGVRAEYTEALRVSLDMRDDLDLVRSHTSSVRETFETL